MDAVLDLDVTHAPQVMQAVAPSLRDTDAVQYDITADDILRITVSADGLGPLRGATSTALMLVKLSDAVLTR